jgi:hypothetical protein
MNKIMSFSGKWMELEIVIFNEINQAQKNKYCKFSFIHKIYKGGTLRRKYRRAELNQSAFYGYM